MPTLTAQGLGGLINKAKAKASDTTHSAPGASMSEGDNGPLPEPPNDWTAETQGEYCKIVLANKRPFVQGEGRDDSFRRLHYMYQMPLTFTWDNAVAQQFSDERQLMWGYMEDISNDLYRGLYSTDGPYLKPKLAKVKEIHLTVTPQKRAPHASGTDPEAHGFFLSFDQSTGVLTAAVSTPDGPNGVSADGPFEHWIIKNVK